MNEDNLISEFKPKLTEQLAELRLMLEDAVKEGWLPGKVLSFFDDAVMMHEEQERFIMAGDGIGTVMSEVREYSDDAPQTVEVDEMIEDLGEIQTGMYQIGENISPV